jgi:hypothetical protein
VDTRFAPSSLDTHVTRGDGLNDWRRWVGASLPKRWPNFRQEIGHDSSARRENAIIDPEFDACERAAPALQIYR